MPYFSSWFLWQPLRYIQFNAENFSLLFQPNASGLKRQNDEIVNKISKHNDMNEKFVLFNWVPVSETKCQNQYVHSRLTKTYNLKRRNVCITPRPSKESSNWNRLIQYLHAHKPCPLNRCVLCIRLLCCCKTEYNIGIPLMTCKNVLATSKFSPSPTLKKKSKSTLAPVSPIVHCGNQTVGHRNYYTKSKLGEISLLQGLRSP